MCPTNSSLSQNRRCSWLNFTYCWRLYCCVDQTDDISPHEIFWYWILLTLELRSAFLAVVGLISYLSWHFGRYPQLSLAGISIADSWLHSCMSSWSPSLSSLLVLSDRPSLIFGLRRSSLPSWIYGLLSRRVCRQSVVTAWWCFPSKLEQVRQIHFSRLVNPYFDFLDYRQPFDFLDYRQPFDFWIIGNLFDFLDLSGTLRFLANREPSMVSSIGVLSSLKWSCFGVFTTLDLIPHAIVSDLLDNCTNLTWQPLEYNRADYVLILVRRMVRDYSSRVIRLPD